MSADPFDGDWIHPVALHQPAWLTPEQRSGLWAQAVGVLAVGAERERRWMYGREITVPRATYHFGLGYSAASGYTQRPAWAGDWAGPVALLRDRLNSLNDELFEESSWRYTGVLVNFYESERDKVAWHHDREPYMIPGAPIASVTLGERRRFGVRPKGATDQGAYRWYGLGDGDLIVMAPGCQEAYEHHVPPEGEPRGLRINFTFRCYDQGPR